MNADANRPAQPGLDDRRHGPRWLIVLLAIAVAVVALVAFRKMRATESEFAWLRVPQRAVAAPPNAQRADTLPFAAGSLVRGNLLLITLDTTRADRLGFHGNSAIRTPVLDQLASRGVVFTHATAPTPTTLPSHASILTGLYPRTHGVRSNGMFRLDDDTLTLAELLREQAYQTAGFISAYVLDARFGLNQGFDLFNDDVHLDGINQHLGAAERSAATTTDHALAWLQSRGDSDQPFFAWVHYFDPHANYAPPEPFATTYSDNLHDGEIAFVDQQIGRLLAGLPDAETAPTLVVVTADHGESLAAHGEHTHGYLAYDVTLRVPLLFHVTHQPLASSYIAHRVSTVDIVPTVLALLGITGSTTFDGMDLTQPPPADRAIYAETYHGFMEYGWAPLLAVYQGDYKLIHGPDPEFYNVARDPFEHARIAAPAAPLHARLYTELRRLFGEEVTSNGTIEATTTVSPDELQRLQALGYVFAGGHDRSDDTPRPDPKDRIDLVNRIFEITCYYQPRGMIEETITRLEALTDRYPDAYAAWFNLATVYWEESRLAEAEGAFAECVALRPRAAESRYRLAQVRMADGRADEAVPLLEELLVTHPDHFEARRDLASALAAVGRLRDAAEHMRRAFELNPACPDCVPQLVRIYQESGWEKQLVELLSDALRQQPTLHRLRNALAGVHARAGRLQRAESVLREGLRVDPDNSFVRARLAWFLVNRPDSSNRDLPAARKLIAACPDPATLTDPAALLFIARTQDRLGERDQAATTADLALARAKQQGTEHLRSAIEDLILNLRSQPSPP
jgi:arylsulfatase A-like enzyme/Flp pilus assembly protein TadD